MRKMEITRKPITDERGNAFTLAYSVTVDDMTAEGLAVGLESYGIRIDIPERSEGAQVRGITVNAASIGTLARLVSENLVTPCTLYDVVYDWLCAC